MIILVVAGERPIEKALGLELLVGTLAFTIVTRIAFTIDCDYCNHNGSASHTTIDMTVYMHTDMTTHMSSA